MSLLSNKELLLAIVPDQIGNPSLRYAKISGRRILKTGDGEPSRFSGQMRVSVFSMESYFEQTDLAAPSAKMLPLVARRHVDTELVFDDESYRLRALSRAKRERTIAADIAAMPERDLDAVASLLPMLPPARHSLRWPRRRSAKTPSFGTSELGGSALSAMNRQT